MVQFEDNDPHQGIALQSAEKGPEAQVFVEEPRFSAA